MSGHWCCAYPWMRRSVRPLRKHMKVLYIFPHPDDESFGPAVAISNQRRKGHEVYLLTLTKGGATRQRLALGLSVDEMGEVRLREMEKMAEVLDLNGMTVLDLPDSGLKEMDPREIEKVVAEHIDHIRPDVIVSYPVHGISGFHDHLVMHAVAKRVFLTLRESGADYLKRLAFYTLSNANTSRAESKFNLNASGEKEIDCVISGDPEDLEAFEQALSCYDSYHQVIDDSGVRRIIIAEQSFEIYQEQHHPPLQCLFEGIEA